MNRKKQRTPTARSTRSTRGTPKRPKAKPKERRTYRLAVTYHSPHDLIIDDESEEAFYGMLSTRAETFDVSLHAYTFGGGYHVCFSVPVETNACEFAESVGGDFEAYLETTSGCAPRLKERRLEYLPGGLLRGLAHLRSGLGGCAA